MTHIWHDFLRTQHAHFDELTNENSCDFGDVAGELAAAQNATLITPLTHLRILQCSGPDATIFLHNQLTSDVKALLEGEVQRSAWCSAKGRVISNFWLFREAADFHLLLSADLFELVQKRLKMYVLRSKVELTPPTNERIVLGLAGSEAERLLRQDNWVIPAATLQITQRAQQCLIRLDAQRFILILSPEEAMAFWTKCVPTAQPAGLDAWRWLDINQGFTLIREATREAFVPQMLNFDKLGIINFRKGCYPGQEIVARTHYLGKIKRHLYHLKLDAAAAAGTPLDAEGTENCGMIAECAPSPTGGFVALAAIQEDFATAASLHLRAENAAHILVCERLISAQN